MEKNYDEGIQHTLKDSDAPTEVKTDVNVNMNKNICNECQGECVTHRLAKLLVSFFKLSKN